ncbi:uncharacterized protein YgbK (DUF1537 family) [Paenibacillus sp. V4I3]|nr:uncharacterized protein YgbK (DUF1537 family) [Paenibacillus sp. V4I3]MDQ0892192.1 uncharacterized protein YgbK (DUF1537 family) [Paenibacillus sp. V4I9]
MRTSAMRMISKLNYQLLIIRFINVSVMDIITSAHKQVRRLTSWVNAHAETHKTLKVTATVHTLKKTNKSYKYR